MKPTKTQVIQWMREALDEHHITTRVAELAAAWGAEQERKRLATVSVEPVGEVSGNAWDEGILYRDREPGEPLYTAEALAAARVQAIEECADKACRDGAGCPEATRIYMRKNNE